MPDGPPPLPARYADALAADPARPVYLLASFGQRTAAYLVDALILVIPVLGAWAAVLPPLVRRAGDDRELLDETNALADAHADHAIGRLVLWSAAIVGAALLCWWLILALYSGLFMSRTEGQTPGRRLLGIRVMRADGRHVGFWWSVMRTLLVRDLLFGLGSLLTGGALAVAQFLWPLWDDDRRALHDFVAHSRVVQDAPEPP